MTGTTLVGLHDDRVNITHRTPATLHRKSARETWGVSAQTVLSTSTRRR